MIQLEPSQFQRQNRCTTTKVLSGINLAIICQTKQIGAPEEAASTVFTNITNLPAESMGKMHHCIGWAGLFQENVKKSEKNLDMSRQKMYLCNLSQKKILRKKQLICLLTWSL